MKPIVRFRHLALATLLAAIAAASLASATAAERIKLATLAPTGSTYQKSLLAMKDAWRKASNGGVDLIVYADGKLGGEADTVGLMGVNSLQAAMLTGVGLAEIERAVTGLQCMPMGFQDFSEVDYVTEKMRPMLEKRLSEKGFIVLFWADAGWVYFFSKKPVTHPADLMKLKLFNWSGNPQQVEIYRSSGFDAVALETADILPGLQTGLIDAAPLPPVFALATQVDTRAPFMLDLNWGPLIGACVIRKATWEKIPAAIREELFKIATETGKEIKTNGRLEMDASIKAMEKRGLKVTKLTPEIEAEWRTVAEGSYPKIRGKLVSEDVFDTALKLIKECRAAKGR